MLALVLALTLGCTDNGADSGAPVGDSGGDGGSEPTVGPCGPWTAIWQVEAEWAWEIDADHTAETEISGGWYAEVQKTESYNNNLVYVFREDIDLNVPGYTEWEDQFEYRYVCDSRGVLLSQFEGLYSHNTTSRDDEGFWLAEFEEPQLLWPYDMAVGDSWGFSTSFNLSYSGGSDIPRPLTVSMEAVAESTITVPAGTYEVLEVDVSWSSDPRHGYEEWAYRAYVAKGVGEIKIGEYAEMVDFDGNPEFSAN